MVLRLAELIVCLMFVAWTVVFPLATLVSLLVTLLVALVLLALVVAPAAKPVALAGRIRHSRR